MHRVVTFVHRVVMFVHRVVMFVHCVVINCIELVTFARYVWPPQDQIDI